MTSAHRVSVDGLIPWVRAAAAVVFGEGSPIPARTGGMFFHALAERSGIPEARWSDAASQADLWCGGPKNLWAAIDREGSPPPRSQVMRQVTAALAAFDPTPKKPPPPLEVGDRVTVDAPGVSGLTGVITEIVPGVTTDGETFRCLCVRWLDAEPGWEWALGCCFPETIVRSRPADSPGARGGRPSNLAWAARASEGRAGAPGD